MKSYADIWQSLAGLAIFMLGMQILENSMSRLSGRRFKLFLKQHAANKIKAIGGGTLITAILQSSSVVNLMVLAFVGAGVLQMQHALALILGANLGTTLNTWLIASLGFSFNIYRLAFPLITIGGIVSVLINKENKIYTWSRMVLALGFLFIGLSFIKDGIIGAVNNFDPASMSAFPPIIYLLAGIIITSILQFSSASMAIALSALFAHAISFQSAMAFTLGAEVGTSTKLLIASIKGSPSKKRVALGSMLFNLIPALLALLCLKPAEEFILITLHISNQIIALALFQSLVNFIAILFFLPLLKPLANFLKNRFNEQKSLATFLTPSIESDEYLGKEAFRNETELLIDDTIYFIVACLDGNLNPPEPILMHPDFRDKTISEKYNFIKQLHNQLREYYIRLQNATENAKTTEELEQWITAARNAMYAAKSMKDTLQDINQLKNSSNNIKFEFYREGKEKTIQFCNKLLVIPKISREKRLGELAAIYRTLTTEYSLTLQRLYKQSMAELLNDMEVSTLINFNRELATAHKSIFFAIKDLLLNAGESSELENLPAFIR